MAMIYDMVTGRVVHDSEYTDPPTAEAPSATPELAVHTIEAGTPIEDLAPVDAYLVMLQDLLKKL